MIMSVQELKRFVDTDEEDSVLEELLQALETLIRSYTNNNFQQRAVRRMADIVGGVIIMDSLQPFKVGDTVQVTESDFNDGLYTVLEVDDSTITVKESTYDEDDVLVTRIVYPRDVKMGVVNLVKWEMSMRYKVGVQSETISRHSITYSGMGDDAEMGYPKELLGFLNPYRKARFGQGVNV